MGKGLARNIVGCKMKNLYKITIAVFLIGCVTSQTYASQMQEWVKTLKPATTSMLVGMDASAEYAKEFAPPQDIAERLDKLNLSSVLDGWNREAEYMRTEHKVSRSSEDYYIEYGIERAINSRKLQKLIVEMGLQYVSTPQRYLYHVPGRPMVMSSENYLVITEKIKVAQGNEPIDLEQTKELCRLAVEGPYYLGINAGTLQVDEGVGYEGKRKVYIMETYGLVRPSLSVIIRNKIDWILCGDKLQQDDGSSGININPDPKTSNHPLAQLYLATFRAQPFFTAQARTALFSRISQEGRMRKGILDSIVASGLLVAACIAKIIAGRLMR